MNRRFLSRSLSIFTLMIALLFSQFIAVASACAQELPGEPEQSAPMAMMMADMSDCADMQSMDQPLVCKAHCQKDAQSADIKLPSVPVPLLLALFPVAPFAETLQPRADAQFAAPPALLAASPPLRIQFQVFRT